MVRCLLSVASSSDGLSGTSPSDLVGLFSKCLCIDIESLMKQKIVDEHDPPWRSAAARQAKRVTENPGRIYKLESHSEIRMKLKTSSTSELLLSRNH